MNAAPSNPTDQRPFGGHFRWLTADEGGRLYQPEVKRFAAFASLAADDEGRDFCIVVEGIVEAADESEVHAFWRDPSEAPVVAKGDIIVISGGHRPIASIVVTDVHPMDPEPAASIEGKA